MRWMMPLLCAAAAAAGGAEGVAAQDSLPPHVTFTLASAAVGETRTIAVYTPPGYDAAGGTRYPVLYMPDGGVGEDFPHVAATVDAGIRAGEIRPMLIVGIENTERRRDMTGPTEVEEDRRIAPRVGGSAAFRRFIAEELMPEVARRYRVTDETAIIGESLAGLFIVETFVEAPGLFDTSIALSPSLWWNGGRLVADAPARLRLRRAHPVTLYLSSADEENIVPQVERLAEALRANGGPTLRWRYTPRPELTHATIYRAEAPRVLRDLFAPADTAGLARAVAARLVEGLAGRAGPSPLVVESGETEFDSAVAAMIRAAPGVNAVWPRPDHRVWVGTRGYTLHGADTAAVMVETGDRHAPQSGIDTYIKKTRYVFVRGPEGWRFVRAEFVSGADFGPVRG